MPNKEYLNDDELDQVTGGATINQSTNAAKAVGVAQSINAAQSMNFAKDVNAAEAIGASQDVNCPQSMGLNQDVNDPQAFGFGQSASTSFLDAKTPKPFIGKPWYKKLFPWFFK